MHFLIKICARTCVIFALQIAQMSTAFAGLCGASSEKFCALVEFVFWIVAL